MKRSSVLSLLVVMVLTMFALTATPFTFAEDGSIIPPRNLTAKAKGKAIELKWEPAAGNFTGYQVKRSEEGGDFRVISFTQATTTSLSDDTVEKGKTYKYMVIATDKNKKESAPSNQVEVKAGGKSSGDETASKPKLGRDDDESDKPSRHDKPQKPEKPTAGSLPAPKNVKAEYNSKDKCVVITWDYKGDKKINGFKVYRSVSEAEGGDEFKKIATLEQLDETEYKDTKVKNGVTYYYYVESFSGVKKSDRSQLASVTVGGAGTAAAGGEAYMGFCVRENSFALVSVNFSDNSVYMAAYSVPRATWEMWTPFGTISTPPNYEAGSVFVDASISDENMGNMYTLYCYNEKAKSLYASTKNTDSSSWSSWKAVNTADLSNPLPGEGTRFAFTWAKKTHWMFAWDVKGGNLKVQAVSSEDGLQTGVWGNPPRSEVPPNFNDDCYVGAGSLSQKGGALYSYLFCFNPEELTLYISGNTSANNNWEPYKVLSNKTVPLPPNMKK